MREHVGTLDSAGLFHWHKGTLGKLSTKSAAVAIADD